jgi:hypothetical protein
MGIPMFGAHGSMPAQSVAVPERHLDAWQICCQIILAYEYHA